MYTEDYHFRKFKNQLNYMIGQVEAFVKYLAEKRNNAAMLHLLQTVNGSSFSSLELFIEGLREKIYTLTNTLLEAKNVDGETRSKALAIREGAATTQPSKLPVIIDELNAMIKFYGLESGE